MSDDEYQKGDIVWAKIRGHPWWPAQICKISKRRGAPANTKYKCSYINDATHSELMSSSLKPFRKFFDEFNKKKIKQKSLRDAIKIANEREQDREKGINSKDYKSESDSIIEDEEAEESESEKSQNSAHSEPPKTQEKSKHEEDKYSKHETEKEEAKVEDVTKKPDLVETPVKLKNSSNNSDVDMNESESGDEESIKNRRRKTVSKSPKIEEAKKMKRIKRKIPITSSLASKQKSKMINKQKSDNSDMSLSDNFQQKDCIKANNLIKAANRKKLNSHLQEIALIRTKLDNVLKEKFTVTDLAASENSEKIMSDLKYLDYLYSERIQDTAKVHTLCKTGISKTLHKFQRYCKQKYKRLKEKVLSPFSHQDMDHSQMCSSELKKMVNLSKKILKKFKSMIHQCFFECRE